MLGFVLPFLYPSRSPPHLVSMEWLFTNECILQVLQSLPTMSVVRTVMSDCIKLMQHLGAKCTIARGNTISNFQACNDANRTCATICEQKKRKRLWV